MMTAITIPAALPAEIASEGSVRHVDVAFDLAMMVIQNGGSTWLADRTFHNALKGFGDSGTSAAWRLDFAAAHWLTANGSATVVRPVGPIAINLLRVSEASMLGEKFARGEVSEAALKRDIERIGALQRPYGRLTTVIAAAIAAMAFCRISGGDWGALGAASFAAAIGQLFRTQLIAIRVPAGAVTLVCGIVSAWIAALGLRLGVTTVTAATLIGSVAYLVPGLPLINGFMDAMADKFLVVGLERIIRAIFLFVVLALAIASAVVVLL